MKNIKETNTELNTTYSSKQKILFNTILLAIPFILIAFLELGLKVSDYGIDLSLFIESENYPGYNEINQDVNLRYFTKVDNTTPTNDIFLVEKPDSCYRIFVFGGSTTRGFPYQASTSFPRILYYRLQDAFPGKRIEVINLSASAINSYSYIDMLDEVLASEPDAILVYGGHNEYYGALGVGSVENAGNARWIKKMRLRLMQYRTFQLMQNSIAKIGSVFGGGDELEKGTLMERIVDDKNIDFESKLYQKGVKQFEDNMLELVCKASKKGVPVVLSELVCNINDQVPFKSSVNTDITALSCYEKAKHLELEGQFDKAKELYVQAKDLDVIRFRAPEVFNDIINDICMEHELALVPMVNYFEKASPNNLIGNELILEHLHPTIDGYFLMADAFFKTLESQQFIASNWDESLIKPASFYRNNWGFTELDSLIGDMNIQSLKSGWPFKPENELNHFVKNFKAEGKVGKMAFDYLIRKGDRHIEDEHIELATYYANNGDFAKAFDEYFSIIKLHPYISDLYYDAINYLIADNKYDEALNLINSAPLIDKNFTYYFTTGILKLNQENYPIAINDLEKAYSLISANAETTKVLLPLYNAYKNVGDSVNEVRIKKIIQEYKPDFGKAKVNDINDESEKVIKITFDEIYERAKLYMSTGEYGKAEELLTKTIKLNETAQAYKLLAMVYIYQKKYPTAYALASKSYQLDATDTENLINYFNLNIMKKDFDTAKRLLNELKYLNVEDEKLARLQNVYNSKRKEAEM